MGSDGRCYATTMDTGYTVESMEVAREELTEIVGQANENVVMAWTVSALLDQA